MSNPMAIVAQQIAGNAMCHPCRFQRLAGLDCGLLFHLRSRKKVRAAAAN